MIPIAIGLGAGSETRQPLGACVIGGMLTSTLLTLVVIPVVYSLMDDLSGGVRRLFGGPRRQEDRTEAIHLAEQESDHEREVEPEVAAASAALEPAKVSW